MGGKALRCAAAVRSARPGGSGGVWGATRGRRWVPGAVPGLGITRVNRIARCDTLYTFERRRECSKAYPLLPRRERRWAGLKKGTISQQQTEIENENVMNHCMSRAGNIHPVDTRTSKIIFTGGKITSKGPPASRKWQSLIAGWMPRSKATGFYGISELDKVYS